MTTARAVRALGNSAAAVGALVAIAICGGYLAWEVTPQAQGPVGTATILGVITDAGQPVSGATVSLGLPTVPDILSDAQGRFAFVDLPAGSYSIKAEKTGYLSSGFGESRPDGDDQQLPLVYGQHITDVVIRLWKLCSISGTVSDDSGEPIVGAAVKAFAVRAGYGGSVAWATSMARTDDRGTYRLWRLRPDYRYFVGIVPEQVSYPQLPGEPGPGASANQDDRSSAMKEEVGMVARRDGVEAVTMGNLRLLSDTLVTPQMAGSAVRVYEPSFVPTGAETTGVQPIKMAPCEEISGIDFRLHAVPTRRISGVVVGPSQQVSSVAVRLIRSGTAADRIDLETALTFTDPTGAFVFPAVPEGSYELRLLELPVSGFATSLHRIAEPQLETLSIPVSPWDDRSTWWATQPLLVGDRDLSAVQVALVRGARIRGRIEFEATDAPVPARPVLQLVRADGRPLAPVAFAPVAVNDAKEFQSIELPPGRYLLGALSGSKKWDLEHVLLNGQDISISPFDLGSTDIDTIIVKFSSRLTEIRGTVRDASNGPDSSAVVVAMPSDSRLWTNAQARWRVFPEVRPTVDGHTVFRAFRPATI